MIKFSQKGDFATTEKYLKKSFGRDYRNVLERYAIEGVKALSAATPIFTGETASSWYYEIEQKDGHLSIIWNNSHVHRGVNIALILQYGHATGNGGYVKGFDYINPALKPIFDKMADAAWKEVSSV